MWQKLRGVDNGTNGREDSRLGVDSSSEKFGSQADKRKRARAGQEGCGAGDVPAI